MASLQQLQYRSLAAKGVIGQVADNGPVVIKLKATSLAGATPTVVVTTTSKITLNAVDYTWASYLTVGALVAAINAAGIFVAKALDTLSSAATGTGLLTNGSFTADANGEFNVTSVTSVGKYLAYRLSYDRTFGTGYKNYDGHRVNLQEIVTSLTLGSGADVNALQVYEIQPWWRGGAEVLIYQKTPVTGSVSTTTWASGNGKISGNDGCDLLVIVTDGDSVTGSMTLSALVE